MARAAEGKTGQCYIMYDQKRECFKIKGVISCDETANRLSTMRDQSARHW